MKIRILDDTVCGGKPVRKGDELEASAEDVEILVLAKRGEVIEEAAEPVEHGKPSE